MPLEGRKKTTLAKSVSSPSYVCSYKVRGFLARRSDPSRVESAPDLRVPAGGTTPQKIVAKQQLWLSLLNLE